jgi:hypothetical protein
VRRTSQKHQKRLVLHLFLISVALFALNVVTGEGRVWENTADDTIVKRRAFNRANKSTVPMTYQPGAKTSLPLFEYAEEVGSMPDGGEVETTDSATPPVEEEMPGEVETTDSATPPVEEEMPVEPEVTLLEGKDLVEAVRGVLQDSVKPKAKDCLHTWWMLDPNMHGQVTVGIVLGPDGLGGAWIHDHADAPLGPVTCFGSAVSQASWPAAAEQVEVRFPFVFNSGEPDTGENSTEE